MDTNEIIKKLSELEKRLSRIEAFLTGFSAYTPSGPDALLPNAESIVKEYDFASASLLQRRLQIGYARAARLLDELEEKGIIAKGEGAKPRKVLIKIK